MEYFRKVLMVTNGKTEQEVMMNSPIVDVVFGDIIGDYWIYLN